MGLTGCDGLWLDNDMTRTQQLIEATAKRDEARRTLDAMPTWNTAKRDAAEELDFWVGKVAALSAGA